MIDAIGHWIFSCFVGLVTRFSDHPLVLFCAGFVVWTGTGTAIFSAIAVAARHFTGLGKSLAWPWIVGPSFVASSLMFFGLLWWLSLALRE